MGKIFKNIKKGLNETGTIIKIFIKNYTISFVCFVVSFFIVIIYVTINTEQKNQMLNLLFNLSLAIIANFIFTFFQVFLPDYYNKKKFQQTIYEWLYYIDEGFMTPITIMFNVKYANDSSVKELNEDVLNKLTIGFDLKSNSSARDVYTMRYYKWIEYFVSELEIVTGRIDNLISRYNKYMDEDLISLLYKIKDCHYIGGMKSTKELLMIDNPSINSQIKSDTFNPYIFDFKEAKKLSDELKKWYIDKINIIELKNDN